MKTEGSPRGYFFVAVGALGLIVAHYLGALSPVEGVWEKAVGALGGPISGLVISVREFPSFYEKQELIKKIEVLETNRLSVEELTIQVETLKQENQSLREAVAWSKTTANPHVISKIIGRPLNLPQTNFIINKGNNDGVVEGLPVVAGTDILIGQIVKTGEESAIIRMLSDSQSKISVKVVGSQEPVGIVVGDLGFSLKLKFIPTSYILQTGDLVVTSGLDSNVPDNLIVGTIAANPEQTDDFFKEATITSVIQFNKLTTVAVVLPRI